MVIGIPISPSRQAERWVKKVENPVGALVTGSGQRAAGHRQIEPRAEIQTVGGNRQRRFGDKGMAGKWGGQRATSVKRVSENLQAGGSKGLGEASRCAVRKSRGHLPRCCWKTRVK